MTTNPAAVPSRSKRSPTKRHREKQVDPEGWYNLPFRQANCWLAAEALWPRGIPADLPPAERDRLIRQWIAEHPHRPRPSAQTIWRALRHFPRQRIRVRRRA
jgi:hypothetical protein